MGRQHPLSFMATLTAWWAPWRQGAYIFSLWKGNVSAQRDSSETRKESMLRECNVNAITVHTTVITTRTWTKGWNQWDINAHIFVGNRFPYMHLKKLSWKSPWLLLGRPLQSRRISIYISEAWLCNSRVWDILSHVRSMSELLRKSNSHAPNATATLV